MKILFFGGTGNISTEVAAAFAARGDSVIVRTTGKHPVPENYDHIQSDKDDVDGLKEKLKGRHFDVAFDFTSFVPDNCRVSYEVLKGKVDQYVFISSATVYKKPHTTLPITEDMPLGNDWSQYARDKIACEEYFHSVEGDDFPVTIVRPSHTFGKTWIPMPVLGGNWTGAQRILDGKPLIVHDKGQSLWTLTAASDFAGAMLGLAGNKGAIGETYHVTSDQPITWNAIFFEIGLALGKQPEIVHIPTEFLAKAIPGMEGSLTGDKAQHAVFDNSKIKKLCPEWECNKSVRAAIRESIAWYNEDPARKEVNADVDKQVDDVIGAWQKQ